MTTTYDERVKQELDTYEHQEEVSDLPTMHSYWTRTSMRKVLDSAGFKQSENMYVVAIREACLRKPTETVQAISFGAGNCDIEIKVAAALVDEGIRNFKIACIEMNSAMRSRGYEDAETRGVLEQVEFVDDDFNTWTADKKYDVFIASHALHHTVELEHLFDEIYNAMYDDSTFVINDIIGRNGHMRWPEALNIMEGLWASMPDRYKWNNVYERTDFQYVNHDCSDVGFEGVRAQDILPLLVEKFAFHQFAAFGNLTDPFIDRIYGANLSPDNPEDTEFFDRVSDLNDLLIDLGIIKPVHMVARLGKTPIENPKWHRHWSPEFCVRPVDRQIPKSLANFADVPVTSVSILADLRNEPSVGEAVEKFNKRFDGFELDVIAIHRVDQDVQELPSNAKSLVVDIEDSEIWKKAAEIAKCTYVLAFTDDVYVGLDSLKVMIDSVKEASPGTVAVPVIKHKNESLDVANDQTCDDFVCILARTKDLRESTDLSLVYVNSAIVLER